MQLVITCGLKGALFVQSINMEYAPQLSKHICAFSSLRELRTEPKESAFGVSLVIPDFFCLVLLEIECSSRTLGNKDIQES